MSTVIVKMKMLIPNYGSHIPAQHQHWIDIVFLWNIRTVWTDSTKGWQRLTSAPVRWPYHHSGTQLQTKVCRNLQPLRNQVTGSQDFNPHQWHQWSHLEISACGSSIWGSINKSLWTVTVCELPCSQKSHSEEPIYFTPLWDMFNRTSVSSITSSESIMEPSTKLHFASSALNWSTTTCH